MEHSSIAYRLSGVRNGEDLSSFCNSCLAWCQNSSSRPLGLPACSQSSWARVRICSSVGYAIVILSRKKPDRPMRHSQAASAEVVPVVAITATGRCTRSDARAGSRSNLPSAHWYSIATLRPSTYPRLGQAVAECDQKVRVRIGGAAAEKTDYTLCPPAVAACTLSGQLAAAPPRSDELPTLLPPCPLARQVFGAELSRSESSGRPYREVMAGCDT
jgi:hypothetical protein